MSWMKVKLVHPNALLPERAHDTDAGLDVFAIENGAIHPGRDLLVRTGIEMAIPDGWCAVVTPKSGRAVKNKVVVGARLIDSDYRGELLIHLFNHEPDLPFTFGIGEKIAQLIVIPCWTGQPEVVEYLMDTERGEGRMGSTGLINEQYPPPYQEPDEPPTDKEIADKLYDDELRKLDELGMRGELKPDSFENRTCWASKRYKDTDGIWKDRPKIKDLSHEIHFDDGWDDDELRESLRDRNPETRDDW